MARPLHLVPIALALVLLQMDIMAQTGAPMPIQGSAVRDPVQGGWKAEDLDRTVELWRSACTVDNAVDLTTRFNLFHSERNAGLARGEGVLKAEDKHRLNALADDLERGAPTSFESSMARFYLSFPEQQAFLHLEKAEALDADRTELLGPLLANAARRMDGPGLKKHALALKARGGVAAGLWHVADDLLLSVEPNGVLFVAGEMDAYPIWVRQYADGKRPDVLVVDVRLLNDGGYRAWVWNNGGAKGAVPSNAAAFLERFVKAATRPVHLSLSLGPERLAPFLARSYATGIALKYSNEPFNNLPLLEARWEQFKKPTDAGPLSRNYLLPASLLLQHYRITGNEAKSARLEQELRRFAKTIGATDLLYRTGVLEH